MLVVTRFQMTAASDGPTGSGDLGPDFLARARTAMDALAARPGFRSGRIGRAVDDPTAWVMTTEWEHVGAYRRALSAYEVKVDAVPLLSLAVDEASAYEVLASSGEAPAGSTQPVAATGRVTPARSASGQRPVRTSRPTWTAEPQTGPSRGLTVDESDRQQPIGQVP